MESTKLVEKFFWFKEHFRAFLVKKRTETFLRLQENSSLHDEKEKFLAGRIGYGGEFVVENIPCEKEQYDEVLDFNNYVDLDQFKQYQFDSVGFEEFVSQYMQ